jgi:hypothetical protein
MFRLEVNFQVVEIAADYSQIGVGRAKPLTIVLVLRRRPRPREGLFAGGVPVVQTGAARLVFGGARLPNYPR